MRFFTRSQRPVRKNRTVMQSTNSLGGTRPNPRSAFNRTVVLRYRFFSRAEESRALDHQRPLSRREAARLRSSDTGLVSPELAAGIRRVKGAKRLGVRIGNWLTVDQARTLLAEPPPDAFEANVTGRFWRCSLDAACDGPNWLDSERRISRFVRSAG